MDRRGGNSGRMGVMGSAGEMGELGGGCRVDLGAEWRAIMVVVWVDLGRKLRGFYWELGALVWMKKKKKKDAEFQWKREGVLGGSELWIALSLLDDQKALKEEEAGGFIRGPERVERTVEFKFHQREQWLQQRRTTEGDAH